MGITAFDIELLDKVIEKYNPKNVIEAGAQNLYNENITPAPYANVYYAKKGIEYFCIDLSKENNCIEWDLSQKQDVDKKYQLVTNFGTWEHIGDNGKFGIEASYNFLHTMHKLLEIGFPIIHENPKTGHWEKHGFIFMTQEFYLEFVKVSGYEIIYIGEVGAMGNWETGMNVFCVLEKKSDKFPTLAQFKKLPLKQK
jgi:hypothetical protein